MKNLVACIVSCALSMPASAVVFTYSGTGGAINDATTSFHLAGSADFIIHIPTPGTMGSLISVTLDFGPGHTRVGDLEVSLAAPNVDDVHLFSRVGVTTPFAFGDDSDVSGIYTFVQSRGADFTAAAAAVDAFSVIAPGTYNRSTAVNSSIPGGIDFNDFSTFVGDSVSGNWTLNIKDWGVGDTGSLLSWSITFDTVVIPSPACIIIFPFAAFITQRRRRHA